MKKKIALITLSLLLSLIGFSQNIFKAIQANDMPALKYLLNTGTNVNAKNRNGDTPLIFAIKAKNLRFANYMLEMNADIDRPDAAGNTALINAVMIGSTDEADLLVNRNANVDIQNKTGINALIAAIKADDVSAVKMLINKGADTMAKDLQRKSAADYAKGLNKADISILLNGATATAVARNTDE